MITILNVDNLIKEKQVIAPITTHQIYFDKSMNYHPQGLYSEKIFGVDGSKEYKTNISYIDLNCYVIHPFIHDILDKRIFRKINDLLSGTVQFSLDPQSGNLIIDENGEITGMSQFIKHIHDIKFSETDDGEGNDRNKIIKSLYKSIKDRTFFVNKIPVISPAYRPIQIDEQTGDVQFDELTKLYQKIIMASTQLASVSGQLYDILSYRMQLLMRDLYELIKVKISKKEGLIRNQLLGRRVDYSARAVITPNHNLDLGYIGIPYRIACTLFEPYMIYGIMSSNYKNLIPDEFHREVKKFLDKESGLDE